VREGDQEYGLAARAAIRAGDARFAVEVLEGRRAGFLNAVVRRRAHRPAGVDKATWLSYEYAADAVAELRAERRAAALAPDPALDERLSEAERRYAAAFAAIYADRTVRAEGETSGLPDFDEVLRKVPPAVTCAYLEVSDRLEVVCVEAAPTVRFGPRPSPIRGSRPRTYPVRPATMARRRRWKQPA
jgi:hypothetical protein